MPAEYQNVLHSELMDGVAVANTVTETYMLGTATPYTLPARALYEPQFRTLRITCAGRWSNTGTPTITFKLRLGTATGGATVCASSAYTTVTGVTNGSFWLEYLMQARVGGRGTTGQVFGMGRFQFADAAAPNAEIPQFIPHATPAQVAMDATNDMDVALAITPTLTWGTQSASNTLTTHLYVIEALR